MGGGCGISNTQHQAVPRKNQGAPKKHDHGLVCPPCTASPATTTTNPPLLLFLQSDDPVDEMPKIQADCMHHCTEAQRTYQVSLRHTSGRPSEHSSN